MSALKQILFQKCMDYVTVRVTNATAAMEEAQGSANSETKSTAGDKHDTARAMMQLAAEQNAKHLAEAHKLHQTLQLIDPEHHFSTVQMGSIVMTSNANYFISISAGKLETENDVYYAISPSSPIAQVLLGLKKGDEAQFNGQVIKITGIL